MMKYNISTFLNRKKQQEQENKEKHDWHKLRRKEELKRFEEIEDFGLDELNENTDP